MQPSRPEPSTTPADDVNGVFTQTGTWTAPAGVEVVLVDHFDKGKTT